MASGSVPNHPAIELLAAAFPQLEIVGLIGRGGMGFVFKARQPKLDRLVALKILAETLSADPSFAERFTREGRALARLSHPNIVTIHDFGQAGPFFYLLMEFIDGVNLRQAMQARQITPSEALAIVPKICEALQYAHGEGILHRDIKPDNILLDAKGRVKIADFGIAKLLNETGAQSSLTGSGATLGTVHYMAPEQIERPYEVDHRADIYSLGVVFYEMLTGELPIGRFPPPSEKNAIDPRLDKVVFKTLAKEPAKRQQTAGELGTDVQTISRTSESSRPKLAKEESEPLPDAKTPLRRISLAKAALFAFAILATLFLAARMLRKPKGPSDADLAQLPPELLSNAPNANLAFPATGETAITLDDILGTAQRLIAKSKTEFGADEIVRAVISYNHGAWATNDLTESTFVIERNGTNREFSASFLWRLPENFATSFDVRVEVQRVSTSSLHRPLPLGSNTPFGNGSVVELFTIRNKDGQAVSGGIEYARRTAETTVEKTGFATLSNFSGNLRAIGDGRNVVEGTFRAMIPSGFRLEAFNSINGEPMRGSTSWQQTDSVLTVKWPAISEINDWVRVATDLAEAGPLRIPTNTAIEAFVITNLYPRVWGRNMPGGGVQEVKAPETKTNIIRGILQLVPIPVGGRVLAQ